VTVEEFGFGLPPRAVTLFKKHGTIFSLNWIPFGGFVRLKGENLEREEDRTAPGSFSAAPIPSRIIILVAGVAMNFLFAMILFAIGFSVGRWIPTYLTYDQLKEAGARGEIHMIPSVLIEEVLPGGTAEKAGVPPASVLAKIDGKAVTDPEEVPAFQKGKSRVQYTLLTGSGFAKEVTMKVSVVNGKTGVSISAFPRELSAPQRSLPQAILLSLREARMMTVQTVIGLEQLFLSLASRGQVPAGVTGIVGIAELTHISVQEGFMTYLRLVALLSLSLAILNILPLPALDGGRLLFVLFELVRRKPANRRFEMTTNLVGFFLLIALIIIITFHDLVGLFTHLPLP
jgi:regulator of sigma E protease